MPFFSIVIPTYNRYDLLPRCLDSVLNQTFLDFEVIVVDNYSEDKTKELLAKYQKKDPRIHFVQEHNNGIIAHSRNVGVRKSSGEYVCFLDSDDWYREDKLEIVYNCIISQKADLIYHPLVVTSKKGSHGLLGKTLTWDNKYMELLIEGDKICNSSVVVRKSVIESIGFISEDPEIVAVEDYDCWLRIANAGYIIVYSHEAAGFYWEGDNFSSSEKQIYKIQALYDRHMCNIPANFRQRVEVARDYTKARIYHSLKKYSKARVLYCKIYSAADKKVKAKLCVLIILTIFRR